MGISIHKRTNLEVQATDGIITVFVDESQGVGHIVKIQIADSRIPATGMSTSLTRARIIAKLLSDALAAYDEALQ